MTQDTEQRRKTRKNTKRQKDEQKGTFTRLAFAMASSLSKQEQKGTFTRGK